MAWSVTFNRSNGIVDLVYTGEIFGNDLREAATKRIAIQEQTGAQSVFVDASKVTIMSAGTLDIFSLPESFYEEKGMSRKAKIAILLPASEKAREDFLFFETACVNRGWIVNSFDSHQNAISWLAEESPWGVSPVVF